ncbi:MAG: hypothetical protein BWY85_02269 [Firmicutes bacterium ADurb.Bin506]|nr:MAG: hypothetical protein BWY85_02269 [Firmicutes bacterium ADurb.Bin506]
MMKRKMNVEDTPRGMPMIPSVVNHMWDTKRPMFAPLCCKNPGILRPKYV